MAEAAPGPPLRYQIREERFGSIAGVPEHTKFQMFGLGRGIDASNPSPLGCSAKQTTVRTVHIQLNNLNENIKRERHSYEETISSLNMHRSCVTASVSDIVGKVVTLQAEAEYKRQNSKEMYTSGMHCASYSYCACALCMSNLASNGLLPFIEFLLLINVGI